MYTKQRRLLTMAKNLKLPNSYGSVSKLGNASRRRKPYIVRITTGYDIDEKSGKSIQKNAVIGYAKTRQEGLQMLAKYHEQPFDLENGNLTFREIYESWSEDKYTNASKSTINGYRAAYNACSTIYEYKFRDLKTNDLQKVIDTCGKHYPTLRKIKILFNQMYAYAMKLDLCGKDYSKYVDITKHSDDNPDKYNRERFTKEQIDTLWKFKDDKYYQIILILTYTGVRINELLNLKKENVHLDERYFFVKKSKNESGIRNVPIGDYIYPFIKNWYDSSECDYLLHTEEQKPFKYRNYYDSYFVPLMEQLGFDQTPHCCRYTCISLLSEANVSPTFQKLIVGHKGAMNITEKVYTHIDMKLLIDAINSMYYPQYVKGY